MSPQQFWCITCAARDSGIIGRKYIQKNWSKLVKLVSLKCTVFQKEVCGQDTIASSLLLQDIVDRFVFIYVDSQDAIKALEGSSIR